MGEILGKNFPQMKIICNLTAKATIWAISAGKSIFAAEESHLINRIPLMWKLQSVIPWKWKVCVCINKFICIKNSTSKTELEKHVSSSLKQGTGIKKPRVYTCSWRKT